MEKREYERIRVNVEGVFLLPDRVDIFREFKGSVEDISEGGIKIVVDDVSPEAPVNSVVIGDVIHFNAFDNYEMYNVEKFCLIEGDAKVVRKDYSNSKPVIGCKFEPISESVSDYIKERKVSSFLASIRQ